MNLKKFFKQLYDKDYRQYLKLHRRHKKELIKLAKKSEDWDYGFLHDYIVTQLKHYLEYYESGWNVWQTDESRNSLIESLRKAVELAEQIENVYDSDSINIWKEEARLYKEFYSYIGENIQRWWD